MSDRVIEVKGVSKRFRHVEALSDLSFGVSEGQCVALVGPNGAGKTTTFRILSGQIRKFDGIALIHGSDVRQRRERIGILIDGPAFYPGLTVRQNLEFLASESDITVEEVERLSDSLLPKDLEPRKAGVLSHGMKQRMGLAVAFLISRGKVLLLDEPLTGLDPEVQHQMKSALRRQVDEGAALLISSHNLPEVEFLADYYVFLQRGKTRAQGGREEFSRSNQVLIRVRHAQRAADVLSVSQFDARPEGEESVIVQGAQLDTEAMARTLALQGIHPQEIIVQRPSLEETYLQLITDES